MKRAVARRATPRAAERAAKPRPVSLDALCGEYAELVDAHLLAKSRGIEPTAAQSLEHLQVSEQLLLASLHHGRAVNRGRRARR